MATLLLSLGLGTYQTEINDTSRQIHIFVTSGWFPMLCFSGVQLQL